MKKNKADWTESLQVFQRLKYRGAAGMLTFALLLLVVVLAIIAARVVDANVQMALVIVSGIVALLFFGSFVLSVKLLGPMALMDASQVMAAYKMATKQSPSISPSGPPVIGSGDGKTLQISEEESGV